MSSYFSNNVCHSSQGLKTLEFSGEEEIKILFFKYNLVFYFFHYSYTSNMHLQLCIDTYKL